MSFRESSVVVIESGRYTVRAGRGLGDFLVPAPSVEIRACVGLRKNGMQIDAGPSTGLPLKLSRYLVGAALDDAEQAGEELDIFWPFKAGGIQDWTQAEAIWRYILFTALQLRRSQNEFPVILSILPNMSRGTHEMITQLFFERFNVAALSIFERPLLQLYAANNLSGIVVDIGRDITDITPIIDCEIHRYGLQTVAIGVEDCELYLAHLLKSNTSVITQLNTPVQLSPEHLNKTLVKLVRQVWRDGLIHVPFSEGFTPAQAPPEDDGGMNIAAVLVAGKEKAVIEAAGQRKKTAAQEKRAAASAAEKERLALDLVDVEFIFSAQGALAGTTEERKVTITLGRERHQFCEPLFDPALLSRITPTPPNKAYGKQLGGNIMGLQEAVRAATATVDSTQRFLVWDGIFLTGDMLSVKNLEAALHYRLSPYVIREPETALHVQPTAIRMLKIPEYFAEYRERGDVLAAFLGACIVAKLTFTDSSGKNFVSKADYAEKGPATIREIIL